MAPRITTSLSGAFLGPPKCWQRVFDGTADRHFVEHVVQVRMIMALFYVNRKDLRAS